MLSTVSPTADRSVAALLEQAADGLEEARRPVGSAARFAGARLAALRGAAAVLAARAQPTRRSARSRSRPRSVWALLANVAPELGEWSAFFACAGERGITTRDADDMLRQAEQFLVLARAAAMIPLARRGRH